MGQFNSHNIRNNRQTFGNKISRNDSTKELSLHHQKKGGTTPMDMEPFHLISAEAGADKNI